MDAMAVPRERAVMEVAVPSPGGGGNAAGSAGDVCPDGRGAGGMTSLGSLPDMADPDPRDGGHTKVNNRETKHCVNVT